MTAANGKRSLTNTIAEETKSSCKFKLNLFLYECVCYTQSDDDDEPNISADCSL